MISAVNTSLFQVLAGTRYCKFGDLPGPVGATMHKQRRRYAAWKVGSDRRNKELHVAAAAILRAGGYRPEGIFWVPDTPDVS